MRTDREIRKWATMWGMRGRRGELTPEQLEFSKKVGFDFNLKYQWTPFNEARKFTHSLKLTSKLQWDEWTKTERKRLGLWEMPTNPYAVYDEWVSWGDWLGTGFVSMSRRKWRSYKASQKFIQAAGIKTQQEWKEYMRQGKRPDDIPAHPHEIYKEWTTWGNWFGTGNKHFKDFLPFTKARKLARSLRLKTSAEWVTWYRKHGANKKVPHTPSQTYPKQFRGWADWLGVRNRRCTLSFTQARTAVRRVIRKHKYPLTFLGFVQLKKDGRLPEGVSAQPWLYPQYKGIEDFVGRSVAQPLRWRPRP